MPPAVARQKNQLGLVEPTANELIRRPAEGCCDGNLSDFAETLHLIKTAAADDADDRVCHAFRSLRQRLRPVATALPLRLEAAHTQLEYRRRAAGAR